MRDLDETDLEILRLLSENARRPYNEIADHVGLTPPAISDRISRLEEQGVIREFTVDLDQSKLERPVSVLVTLRVEPADVDDVYATAADLDGVENVFETLDGSVVVYANLPDTDVRSWLESRFELSDLVDYEVSLLNRADRIVGVSAAGFALECVVCGTETTGNAITRTIDGEIETFCCPSCADRHVTRNEARQEADD
ncbi:winged helix-turn-helix transcriptional regulator [Natrialbaceae archaeon GCM10025810]|uniref:winged helix-turn-helix transcriptional regulator n=1 Tax=Halovalidus salilacus TaxID=3075124 RepID=UPI00361813BC